MFGRGAGNRYGTEDDKVNCMFYLKTGVCRHFDKCSKQHVKPVFSRILLCKNLWSNPYYGIMPEDIDTLDETFLQNQFDGFFEEVFEFFSTFGPVEDLQIAENVGNHFVGHTYVSYADEETAENALQGCKGAKFAGKQIQCEYSPVSDFRDASCRDFDEAECARAGFCNYMHARQPSQGCIDYLRDQFDWRGGFRRRGRDRDRDGDRDGGRGGGGRDYRRRDRDDDDNDDRRGKRTRY